MHPAHPLALTTVPAAPTPMTETCTSFSALRRAGSTSARPVPVNWAFRQITGWLQTQGQRELTLAQASESPVLNNSWGQLKWWGVLESYSCISSVYWLVLLRCIQKVSWWYTIIFTVLHSHYVGYIWSSKSHKELSCVWLVWLGIF